MLTAGIYASLLLYPVSFNVAKFKPISVYPPGSTCGLDGLENFCSNQIDSSSCIQIHCEQICPFGKIYSGILFISKQVGYKF